MHSCTFAPFAIPRTAIKNARQNLKLIPSGHNAIFNSPSVAVGSAMFFLKGGIIRPGSVAAAAAVMYEPAESAGDPSLALEAAPMGGGTFPGPAF